VGRAAKVLARAISTVWSFIK